MRPNSGAIACAVQPTRSGWRNSLQRDGQSAWLAGMMLRLGELLMAQVAPETWRETRQLPPALQDPLGRPKTPDRVNGMGHHGGAGPAVELSHADHAGAATGSHPLTEQAYSRLGAVLPLASSLADTPDAGPQALDALPREVLNHLSLDPAMLQQRLPKQDKVISF